MKYFVWLPGLRGPEPQLWDHDLVSLLKPLEKILVDDNLSLSECVAKFPLSVKSND